MKHLRGWAFFILLPVGYVTAVVLLLQVPAIAALIAGVVVVRLFLPDDEPATRP